MAFLKASRASFRQREDAGRCTDYPALLARLSHASVQEVSETSRKRARYQKMTANGHNRDTLLESYTGLMREAIDALGSEERHQVYRMLGLDVRWAFDGSFDLSGDVINFSKVVISSS